MIETKNFIKLSILSFILVAGIGIASFILSGPATDIITGRVTATAYILETPRSICSFELKQGLNLVSFYCETGFYSVNETLINSQNQSLNYYAVFSYRPDTPSDRWASSNPHLPNWTSQQLTTIDRKQAYWIYMNSTGTYSREGFKFSSTGIPIYPGWNLVGYPTDIARDINLSLNSIAGQYTIVESYQRPVNAPIWLTYEPGFGGNLTQMEPLKGYWINATSAGTIIVDW